MPRPAFVFAALLAVAGPAVSLRWPASAHAAGQAVHLERADGSRVGGRLVSLGPSSLALDTGSGTSLVPLADVVLIESDGPPGGEPVGGEPVGGEPAGEVVADARLPGTPQAPGGRPADSTPLPPDLLLLRGGDTLAGRIAGGAVDALRFELDGGTEVTIPLDLCERILPRASGPLDRLARLADGGHDDRLWRRRADGGFDGITGVLDRVEGEDFVFEGALGALRFPRAEVVGVVLAPLDPAPRVLAGPEVVLRLAGGSRLRAGLLDAGDGRVALSTAFSDRVELPLASLVSCVVSGELSGARRLLSELVPVEVEQHPSVGGPQDVLFPWQRDLSVGGRALSVGGRARATGLSVHAIARLVYELPPGARALRVTVGLCDEVSELPARGSCDFEIRVDGELRASAGVLHGGDEPVVLRVEDLRGGKRLELVTGDAGDDDAGDRAAWVDGVLFLDRD